MDILHTFVAVTLSDGSMPVLGIILQGRGDTLPYGAAWVAPGSGWWVRPDSDAVIFAEVQRTYPGVARDGTPLPTAVRYNRVTQADLPSRAYRDAWVHDGAQVTHDLTKAKAIHVARVRRARDQALEQLDRDWMRATGQGNTAEADAVEAERQALRDAPQTLDVDRATTVEELQALWPAGLPRN